jgi:hypothetical protein
MAKKQPKFEYGIEITKPWSIEMYDHNEILGEKLRIELMETLNTIVEHQGEDEIRKFSKAICYHGFGEGYSYDDIVNETRLDIETLANFQMNEDLDWYINNGYIQQPEKRFIGYGK